MDDDSLDSIAQGENVLSRYYFGLMYRYMLTDITLGDQSASSSTSTFRSLYVFNSFDSVLDRLFYVTP